MCAIHQTRTIIFFCYIFAFFVDFLLYPPYSVGNTPFQLSTLLVPVILAIALHLLLTICYVFGALFERASWRTGIGLIFLLHAPIPLVLAIGGVVLLNEEKPNYWFAISVLMCVGVFLDFICGVVSRPSQKILLSFELIAACPCFLLTALYQKKILTKVWAPFVPPFAYIFIYFIALVFLTPCCGSFGNAMRRFFADPEIAAEFQAAMDPQLKPFKVKTDWNDETDIIGSDRNTNRREKVSKWKRNLLPEKITRFPSRAEFQLYNIEATPENPVYLASPLPMLALAVVLSICLVNCLHPLSNFYFWVFFGVILLAISILLNTRATACSFLAFTNLDNKSVDVLWDHPSLSIL